MEIKHYTASFFEKSMPDWKKKKDPLLVKLVFRPISYYISSFCANRKISANDVSFVSIFVGILACVCFYFHNYALNILGASLIFLWLLLDCVDGNLSRGIGHQAYGEYFDAMSSYTLVALLGVSLGYCAFVDGGIFMPRRNEIVIILGALASVSDTLMRLSYQKFRSNSVELQKRGLIPNDSRSRSDFEAATSLKVRIEQELGIATAIPVIVLIATISHALDLAVIYMFVYYFGSAIFMICSYLKKGMKHKRIFID